VGAHIAVPRGRVGNVSAITIVSPLDGRVMFVLPSGAHTIIGTTERAAKRGPDDIRATEADIAYLLTSVNRVLPHAALERDDVISAWAGIRPLAVAHVSPGGANAASREHAVTRRDDGLVSVTGGKLTTYRAMAADVLQHAVRGVPASHGATQARASRDSSSTTPLPGGESRNIVALEREATAVTGDRAVGTRLVQAFGSAWADVWAPTRQDADLAERLVEQLPYTRAELVFSMEREQACTLSDLLVRRTHVAFETRDHGRATARRVAPLVAARLGWSDVRTAHALAEYDADVARLFAVEVA
jgi:glycerol-3-phosphate dehydrogenase